MYLGRCGSPHKGAEIEIFRENLDFYRAALNREAACGMSPNLGLGNYGVPQCGSGSCKQDEKDWYGETRGKKLKEKKKNDKTDNI